jgi:chromosomal replication initiation ATPase DnaA
MSKETIVILKMDDRINYVIQKTCEYFEVSRGFLLKQHRNEELITRKRLTIKLLRDVADCNFKNIGFAIGNGLNHCLTNYTIITEQMYSDKKIKKMYDEIVVKILKNN